MQLPCSLYHLKVLKKILSLIYIFYKKSLTDTRVTYVHKSWFFVVYHGFFYWYMVAEAPASMEGTIVTLGLIIKLWDIAWDLSNHCISIIHSKDSAEHLQQMNLINQDIQAEYLCGPHGLRPHDQRLFHKPLDIILASPLTY